MLHKKTNLMHSHIRLVTGRNVGATLLHASKIRKEISSWRKRRYYLGGTKILVSYNGDRGDMTEIVAEAESPITQREVEHVLRRMSMKKSPDPGDITTKMLVAAG